MAHTNGTEKEKMLEMPFEPSEFEYSLSRTLYHVALGLCIIKGSWFS